LLRAPKRERTRAAGRPALENERDGTTDGGIGPGAIRVVLTRVRREVGRVVGCGGADRWCVGGGGGGGGRRRRRRGRRRRKWESNTRVCIRLCVLRARSRTYAGMTMNRPWPLRTTPRRRPMLIIIIIIIICYVVTIYIYT